MMSVIVLSSDGYSDCWNPFFKLFEEHFPKMRDLEIILSTNEKTYSHKSLNITTIAHGMDVPWSKRLRLSLEATKNEIVLVVVEDFFLNSKMDEKAFTKVFNLISNENEIDHIRLLNTGVYESEASQFELIDKIIHKTKKRFLYSAGLWKKEVLKKYLNDHESPWIAEKMAHLRAKIYRHGFYCVSKDYIDTHGQLYAMFFSGVLYKGQCAEYVVPFLKKEGFTDLLKRGVIKKSDFQKNRFKAKIKLILDFRPILKSYLNIVALFIKVRIFKIY